jgi:DNA-binding SARP family transcriptional activator
MLCRNTTGRGRGGVRIVGKLGATDDGGQPVYVGSAYKPRLLLALALSRPGRVLPVDWLVDAMWADSPPRSARRNIYQYAQRLRSALSPARLQSIDGGYVLQLQAHDVVDALRFQAVVDEAGLAAEDPARVRRLLEEALALWHDPPLVEFGDCEPLTRYAADLQQRWLNAQHRWARASIALGSQERVVECLSPVVAAHPFREDLCSDLMLALYQAGRQTDALDLYRRSRQLLITELGVEPSGELQRLHLAVLNGDRALTPGEPHWAHGGSAAIRKRWRSRPDSWAAVPAPRRT